MKLDKKKALSEFRHKFALFIKTHDHDMPDIAAELAGMNQD
jgi:hypothetical protein